jgi:putative membrane protein
MTSPAADEPAGSCAAGRQSFSRAEEFRSFSRRSPERSAAANRAIHAGFRSAHARAASRDRTRVAAIARAGMCIARMRCTSLRGDAAVNKPFAFIAVIASLVLMGTALAQNDRTDMQFATTAAKGGIAEVALGQMAEKKAQSADVKAFGQRMATDHKKANDELNAAAKADGVTIPQGLTGEHNADAAKLSKLSGGEFDREYMKLMVDDHQKDIALFEKESKTGKDSHVKAFAGKTLPTLREHLKMAQDIESKMHGGASPGAQ